MVNTLDPWDPPKVWMSGQKCDGGSVRVRTHPPIAFAPAYPHSCPSLAPIWPKNWVLGLSSLLNCMVGTLGPGDPPKCGCLCENAMEGPFRSLSTSLSHFRTDIHKLIILHIPVPRVQIIPLYSTTVATCRVYSTVYCYLDGPVARTTTPTTSTTVYY